MLEDVDLNHVINEKNGEKNKRPCPLSVGEFGFNFIAMKHLMETLF